MVKSVSIPSHFPQIYQLLVPLNVPGQGGNFLTVMPCVCVDFADWTNGGMLPRVRGCGGCSLPVSSPGCELAGQ